MGKDTHEKRRRRLKGPPFVQMFNYVIDSPAYAALSVTARAALIEVARLYDGANNGRLAMAARTLADRLDVSKSTAARAMIELEDAGFVETAKIGSFRRRDRRASEYRLTFHRCDASYSPPSKAFLKQTARAHGVKNTSSGPTGETVST